MDGNRELYNRILMGIDDEHDEDVRESFEELASASS